MLAGPLEAGNIRVDVGGDLPTIRGDRLRLSEVMQNLIDNGIKFMGDQPMPVIEVGAQGMDADGKPIFFVRDNGIGIDPQYHEHIFGLFNRLDLNVDGIGVGLTIVRRIIEVHGRRIWIESALGKGATFFFTLPAETS